MVRITIIYLCTTEHTHSDPPQKGSFCSTAVLIQTCFEILPYKDKRRGKKLAAYCPLLGYLLMAELCSNSCQNIKLPAPLWSAVLRSKRGYSFYKQGDFRIEADSRMMSFSRGGVYCFGPLNISFGSGSTDL
jgi:hypothetical protein